MLAIPRKYLFIYLLFIFILLFSTGPEDEEVSSAESHKETIEIQHSKPEVEQVPETTRVTKTFQVEGQPEDTIIVPEETTHTEAIRIDKQPKQMIIVPTPEQRPQEPKKQPAFEIRVGVPKTMPSTTGEKVTETTTYTTITSQIHVSTFTFY